MIIDINTTKDITDVEALRNKSWFQIIFTRYAGRLYRTATRYMNTDNAKDIVQELMIETWNKRNFLTGSADGCLQNYLFIRLKYKIIDFYSKKPEQVLWEEALPELIHLSATYAHEETILKELKRIIDFTIREMRPSEREVFRLRWEQQLSVQETAKSLDISPKSVMNRFATAMKMVRENVLEYYNEEPAAEYQLAILTLIISKIIA
ncbi:RNA polymerase sigma factor [Proteiniphilum acetatigenes]|uniref:RNA polymerase sigma factor n=1 Tax=Proteiniphilum acetatigenes TaxID=294710 RepID=UPI00037EF574|nr:sigma-70 family RNA polymerase sigma factor [Proteiniphilum acetatigenes]